MSRQCLTIFLLIFILSTPLKAKSYLDISYVDLPVSEKQTLDIYAPDEAFETLRPVHIYVHGGGWNIGDKRNFISRSGVEAKQYVDRGIVLVSVNYRLSPEYRHPAHVQDLAAAMRWIHDNIHHYGGDKKNVVLSGHSAGAHLVTLLGVNSRFLTAQGLSMNMFKSIVAVDSAAYDLTKKAQGRGRFIVERWKKAAFGEDQNMRIDPSPIFTIKKGEGLSPFLFFDRGGQSLDVLNHNSKKMVKILQGNGYNAKQKTLDARYSHADMNDLIFKDNSEIFNKITSLLLEE